MENIEKEFILDHHLAVIATCSGDNPHCTPVYYLYDEEKNLFYFVTKDETRKFSNIKDNKKVFLSIFNEKPQQVYSANCKAKILSQKKAGFDEVIERLIEIHAEQDYFPTPLSYLKEGKLSLIELSPEDSQFNSYHKKTE